MRWEVEVNSWRVGGIAYIGMWALFSDSGKCLDSIRIYGAETGIGESHYIGQNIKACIKRHDPAWPLYDLLEML